MKTLLQINSVASVGSTGRIAKELGQVAFNNGWNSYIAFGRNKQSIKSGLIKIGTDWDMKLHWLQTRLFDRHGLASYQATKKFIEEIEEIQPDIIHLHNLHGYYLNYELLFNFLALKNIPVVWTLHDCWPMTGHCAHFEFVDCNKWKTYCNSCPQKKSYPASLIMDRSLENFAKKKALFNSVERLTIITVSNWLEGIVKESFLSRHAIHVINNGINTEIFTPYSTSKIKEKYQLFNKFIILGVTNIWSNRKGFNDFIRMSKILNNDFQIILVGLNQKQIKMLPTNIIGIEKTESQTDLANLYSAADVYVNPTWEDSFPTTNIESLSCGTPVITYRTGGSPEAIDLKTGIIVEKGDLNSLIIAIETIRNNGKENYSDACRSRALKMYDKNDRYMDYLNLYDSMLK